MAFRSLLSTHKIKNVRALCATNILNYNYVPTRRITSKKSIYNTSEARKIRSFVVQKYLDYLNTYTKVLENKFPDAMYVYRVFIDGIREFFKDSKSYIKIVRTLHSSKKGLEDLKLSEIELYHQMPKDMKQVAPVLLISALPFANYVIFPIAYYFPRHLLCRHFWNLQQKSEFSIILLRKRLIHYRPVFRHLQLQLPLLKDSKLHKKWSNILGQIGSGVQPTADDLLECMDLFTNGPYHLMYLSGNHIRHLLKMHELHIGWFRRTRLSDKAIILQAMDQAIVREGGPEKLSTEALKNACLIRGLNPTNMNHKDMIKWITKWITISRRIEKETLSLLLHCPILLAYNEPTNWQLIYSHKITKET